MPFASRPEWAGVVPVPQDDGPNPICPIAYAPQCTAAACICSRSRSSQVSLQVTHTMDYFRAVLHKDERTERALRLTKEVIKLNAANYTAWYRSAASNSDCPSDTFSHRAYRRNILTSLNCDLRRELLWVDKMAIANPKNYQLWCDPFPPAVAAVDWRLIGLSLQVPPQGAGGEAAGPVEGAGVHGDAAGRRLEELPCLGAPAVGAGDVRAVGARAGLRGRPAQDGLPQQLGLEPALLCHQQDQGLDQRGPPGRDRLRPRLRQDRPQQPELLELPQGVLMRSEPAFCTPRSEI